MKFLVYHVKNPTFFPPHPEWNQENYEHVAEVDTTSLEEVFRVTNHIDEPWWKNKEVTWYKPNSRSTSVGDVVTDGAGMVFRCEGTGWQRIDDYDLVSQTSDIWGSNGSQLKDEDTEDVIGMDDCPPSTWADFE